MGGTPTLFGQRPGRVGPEAVHDGEQVGVVGLEAVDGDREAGEELLRAAVVARAGVGERPQQGEPVGDPGVAGAAVRRPARRGRSCAIGR